MPLALLADENISGVTIRLLREQGFDVLSIGESRPSLCDREVLALAREQHRWLVTFDRDYGDLVFNQRAAPPLGIICLRFSPLTPEEPATRIIDALKQCVGEAAFVVVSRQGGMRMRPFPVHDQ